MKPLLFRFIEGSLKESMATVITVSDENFLINHIKNTWNLPQ
jgi:hypothetical protein